MIEGIPRRSQRTTQLSVTFQVARTESASGVKDRGSLLPSRSIPMTDGRPYGILRSLDKEGLSMSQRLPGLIAGLAAEGETPPAPHLEMIYGECDEVNAGRWLRE